MDAYLTPDARLELEAPAAASGRTDAAGFLLGHVRSGRFIVEGIVPAPSPAEVVDPEAFFRLDALTPDRVIGFLLPAAATGEPLLRPHACGKLVLTPKAGTSGRTAWAGRTVELDDEFSFTPVKVFSEPARKP